MDHTFEPKIEKINACVLEGPCRPCRLAERRRGREEESEGHLCDCVWKLHAKPLSNGLKIPLTPLCQGKSYIVS